MSLQVSDAFKAKLKLADKPAYRICQQAGVNPTTISKLIRGAYPVQENDSRIVKVAEVLGMSPNDAFETAG